MNLKATFQIVMKLRGFLFMQFFLDKIWAIDRSLQNDCRPSVTIDHCGWLLASKSAEEMEVDYETVCKSNVKENDIILE